MKGMISFFIVMLSVVFAFAQVPQKMTYQSVIRDQQGNLVVNSQVGIKISILRSSPTGTAVFQEVHSVTTNGQGLATLEIGGLAAGFSTIDWGNGVYYLKTQTDPNGGTNYTVSGTAQILSVPYAQYANRVNADNLPKTKVTAINPPGCQSVANINTSWKKLTDLGTFVKNNSATLIDLDYQTHFYATSVINAVIYQLRIDNNPTTLGQASFFYHSGMTGKFLNGHITGTFSGLSTGTHTVSVWVKTATDTAAQAYIDPGCYNSASVNTVIVKEYY